jgi:hypothetical protein
MKLSKFHSRLTPTLHTEKSPYSIKLLGAFSNKNNRPFGVLEMRYTVQYFYFFFLRNCPTRMEKHCLPTSPPPQKKKPILEEYHGSEVIHLDG